jgi:carbamoyltransferase
MKILSISIGHDSSCCIFQNSDLIYYRMAERVSRVKHDHKVLPLLEGVLEHNFLDFDTIVVSYFLDLAADEIDICLEFISKYFRFRSLKIQKDKHHLFHAFCGMYFSGSNESLVVVLDGSGSHDYDIMPGSLSREIESIYYINFHEKKIINIYKHFNNNAIKNHSIKENIEISNSISVGWSFENCSESCGFDIWGGGKVMALAAFYQQEDLLENSWKDHVEKSYICQQESENRALDLIYKAISTNLSKNLIISGGYGLNCVSNYTVLRTIEGQFDLFVDPVCFDAGISIGAAVHELFTTETQTIDTNSNRNVYLGNDKINYNWSTVKYFDHVDIDYIVNLIVGQNAVGIFQGKSEAGQRALGNRSIIFDPRIIENKKKLNLLKGRESFRPFGGSMLQEEFKNYFPNELISNSYFMQYAFPVNEIQKTKIPAVLHVDNTSRIQTVTESTNKLFYKLIKKFYEYTGVPILGNTSLNYAGDPLVETVEDAIEMLRKSQLEYLYFPEIKRLIYVKNEC